MKRPTRIAVALLVAGATCVDGAQAQRIDLPAVESMPVTETSYAVEIYLDYPRLAITPGGTFDRYWRTSHGGLIRISDSPVSQLITDALHEAAPHSGRTGSRALESFLSEVNVVVTANGQVYFVHDDAMLADGEQRLRVTPDCIRRIVAGWPLVPGKNWGAIRSPP